MSMLTAPPAAANIRRRSRRRQWFGHRLPRGHTDAVSPLGSSARKSVLGQMSSAQGNGDGRGQALSRSPKGANLSKIWLTENEQCNGRGEYCSKIKKAMVPRGGLAFSSRINGLRAGETFSQPAE
ncbi:hypothetical protein ACFOGJ_04120, partial [Marinibaculum pumilum]